MWNLTLTVAWEMETIVMPNWSIERTTVQRFRNGRQNRRRQEGKGMEIRKIQKRRMSNERNNRDAETERVRVVILIHNSRLTAAFGGSQNRFTVSMDCVCGSIVLQWRFSDSSDAILDFSTSVR